MQITALVENSSLDKNLGTEHGLSLYIETGSRKILFDMGQTELFADNARVLGIDLAGVDIAVLSHGHYDHGGGLKKFLDINRKAPVYLSRYAFEGHYHGREKYIGLDTELTGNERLVSTGDETVIEEGLTLYSCNDCQKTFPSGSQGLHMIKDGAFLPEDFRHEQYLLIKEKGKRVVFSGCSHKGILNIVEWFRPDVLVGGFHFSKLPLDETLAGYAEYLNRFSTVFYTCHCTGTEQFAFMKTRMDRLFYLAAGQRMIL
jgi:7,8-dihydropterin-6-yl-methyl-4-(beta-D-ribofuranosyl)aminobenzene 5'-phosphate synthase